MTVAPLLGPAGAALTVVSVGLLARAHVVRPARRLAGVAATRPARGRSRLRSNPTVRTVGTVAASLAVAVVAGPLAVGVVLAAVLALRHAGPIVAAKQRRTTIERSLPEAMELLVLSVRAGLTPFQAVCDLATYDERAVGDAFAEVVRRTQRGQPFADALAALPEQLGARAGGLADVIATSDRHGLPLGPVLDHLTDDVRASRRRFDQATARKLPVRLSFPLVVCTLPSFVLLAIAPAMIAALSSLSGTAW